MAPDLDDASSDSVSEGDEEDLAGLLANGRDPARCHIVKRSVATEEETRLPPFSFENTRVDPSTHLPGRSIQEHLPIDSPPEAEPCRSPGQIQEQLVSGMD